MALFFAVKRTATVEADTWLRMHMLHRRDFVSVQEKYPLDAAILLNEIEIFIQNNGYKQTIRNKHSLTQEQESAHTRTATPEETKDAEVPSTPARVPGSPPHTARPAAAQNSLARFDADLFSAPEKKHGLMNGVENLRPKLLRQKSKPIADGDEHKVPGQKNGQFSREIKESWPGLPDMKRPGGGNHRSAARSSDDDLEPIDVASFRKKMAQEGDSSVAKKEKDTRNNAPPMSLASMIRAASADGRMASMKQLENEALVTAAPADDTPVNRPARSASARRGSSSSFGSIRRPSLTGLGSGLESAQVTRAPSARRHSLTEQLTQIQTDQPLEPKPSPPLDVNQSSTAIKKNAK